MKALPMPSGQNEGTANFPYQILLVSFHLQYRNDYFFVLDILALELVPAFYFSLALSSRDFADSFDEEPTLTQLRID